MITSLLFIASAFSSTIVSHKGIWVDHVYPANTQASIIKALNNGFKAVEFDVLMTKDNQIVLSHDNSIGKVSSCDVVISDALFSELEPCEFTHNTTLPLTQLLRKAVEIPQKITRLDSLLLELFEDERAGFIWIDLKVGTYDAAISMARVLNQFDQSFIDKIVVNSTSADTLVILKSLVDVRTSLEGEWGSEPLEKYDIFFENIGVTHDLISLNIGIPMGFSGDKIPFYRTSRFKTLLKRFYKENEEFQVPIIGWTVNSKKELKMYANDGVEYLLTDLLFPEY